LTLPSPNGGSSGRPIPIAAILLIAVAIHGPLLLRQMPTSSFDANTHMFFASHYAHHWFNPWNEKWFGGFSQTTYPPLAHQWIALFSHVIGLNLAYMFVQLCAILLLPIGMYRYARLWVDERSASYAALGSVFLGSVGLLVYQSGQLPTTLAGAITLNALPYFYRWMREPDLSALVKGVLITVTAGAVHHVTLLFATVLFALPVFWLAVLDRHSEGTESSVPGEISRGLIFTTIVVICFVVVLLPYWMAMIQNPIRQVPIPHDSRNNFITDLAAGFNFWIIPFGTLVLALPFVFMRGASERRLRPLFFGFWLTLLFSMGGTTPVPRFLLDYVLRWLTLGEMQNAFAILTYERFAFWATLMAMPIVGLMALELINRYSRKAVVGLWIAAVASFAMAVSWTYYRPISDVSFNTQPIIDFLNREEHSKFRYLTLGMGIQFSYVSTHANANTIDGDYNSARQLPELTEYGAAKLDNAKFFGTAGMESLRAMLKHANKYGIKYIFVRDPYYEPLLAFAGWRKTESYDRGNVTMWSREDIPPARKIDFPNVPPAWQGIMWGLLPILSSILAILAVLLLPERVRARETLAFPAAEEREPVYLREAK